MQDKKIIAVLVSNDLITDQRVSKMCDSLVQRGYMPVLIGRLLPGSLPMNDRNYSCIRLKLWFKSGLLFYANLNLALFFKLLFLKCNGIHANDLDTLLPAFMVSRIRNKKLVYDTHEYFTGVPELLKRPAVRKVWKSIESFIFPKLKNTITVNDSIANLYFNDYGIKPSVIRNIPAKQEVLKVSRKELNLPENKFLIILQGSGINVDRGGEEAVEMMHFLDDALLIIAGSGDVLPLLREKVDNLKLENKIIFKDKMPYKELMKHTSVCDLGLTLDKDTNINYRFSLPNKLFDYIHAGIPTLASDLPEVKRIINTYKIGLISPNHNPKILAEIVSELMRNSLKQQELRNNCNVASKLLSWENEANILSAFYP